MNEKETKIIEQLKQGDENAYVSLFYDYYVSLCRYSKRYVGRKDLAEDIVSETFFIVWKKRKKLDITSSLKSYLFRAVYKNSLNYLRKQKKMDLLEDHLNLHIKEPEIFSGSTNDSPSELLFIKDLGEKIKEGVERLPPQQKNAFILKRYEGKKNKEVAEIMGLSVKTVEMHMAKAMLSLRNYLKDYAPIVLFLFLLKSLIHF